MLIAERPERRPVAHSSLSGHVRYDDASGDTHPNALTSLEVCSLHFNTSGGPLAVCISKRSHLQYAIASELEDLTATGAGLEVFGTPIRCTAKTRGTGTYDSVGKVE